MNATTRSTMTTELRLSQRAGWAEGQPISDLMARALANPQLISLAAGFVDQATLPVELTRRASGRLLQDADRARAALQYGTTPGFPPLREAILERFLEHDRAAPQTHAASPPDPALEQVVITAGSNQMLHLVGESLLNAGDIVLCAAPTYLVFLGTLGNIGARAVGVACDEQGLLPEALEASLQSLDQAGELGRVKIIYLVPYFDNPAGTTIDYERRSRIVQIARSWSHHGRIHVISDDAYRQLRYEGQDIASMRTCDPDGETVIVAGTFSKSFSPGIRVGWGILPRHLVGPVCNQKGNIDFGSPNFSQHLMAAALEGRHFESHVESICDGYRDKMYAMLAAADEHLANIPEVHWVRPEGGLYIWLTLPAHVDTGPTGRLFNVAIEEGVLYVPGQFCFPTEGEPVQKNTIRLSFGVQTCEKIREGMAALGRAIRKVAE